MEFHMNFLWFYIYISYSVLLVHIFAEVSEVNLEFCPKPSSLKSLVLLDTKIYEILKSHEALANTSYVFDYESSTGIIGDDNIKSKLNIVTQHPFLTLRMIYRLTYDINLQDFESRLMGTNHTELLKKINETLNEVESNIGWPGEEYFAEICMGIIRIHDTYDIDLAQFVNGFIMNIPTNFSLQSRHCYSIGVYASELGFNAIAVEWLEMSKSLALAEGNFYSNADSITEYLGYAVEMHDYEYGTKSNRFHSKLFVEKLTPYQFRGFVPKLKRSTLDYRHLKGSRNINRMNIDFKGLCAGENFQTDVEKSRLYCKLETKRNPFFVINPLQVEVLSIDPHIIQIYNVISDSTIEKMKNFSEPLLNKAGVRYQSESKNSESEFKLNYRSSLNTWIPNEEFPESDSIFARRIELITGLKIISQDLTEELQIAIYNFGGHFDLHVDMDESMRQHGFRMATFIYYLNDVDAGGYTAFPVAGVAAKPVKGSGVFWYNVNSEGESNTRTYHGACPVVLGELKWVANKWIGFQNQYFYNQCKKFKVP